MGVSIDMVGKSEITVLYVEDDPVARNIVSAMIALKFPGLKIVTAENGQIGLERFKQHRPDFVITDISMPLIDGIQMAKAIRAVDSRVNIVFITALNDSQCLMEAIKVNTSHYVLKPIDNRLLFEVIDDCVARISLEREVKEQNEQIRKLNEELEQRVKERTVEFESVNKELESFCYSVSHDMRAPLRHIEGYTRIFLEEHGAIIPREGQEYLEKICNATKRMGTLIDDLLNLSRITRNNICIDQIDLSRMAQEISSELAAAFPERQVTITIKPGIRAEGDANLLRIVMENLLYNAWKYTRKKESAEIAFGETETDGERVFYVRDNGAGFDMAYYDKLFGAFQRLHNVNEYEGTGIGLATVKRIIQRHGGKVWGEGKIDAGATFYFTINR
jgi:two-component system sensor histidine kinase/response regulator